MNNEVDPEITFDMSGVCNHCREYTVKEKQRKLEKTNLPLSIYEMKKQEPYHCLLGLSGGVDSSICLHYLIEQGVKPLCFSVDNGWNLTKEADENILKMVEHYKVPFYRFTIDLKKFRELQISLIKAGIKNLESATDHILQATTYEMARKYGIKYIISGGNLATESIMPKSFGHNARDLTFLKTIYRKFTGKKFTGLPTISLFQYLWYRFIKRIKIIQLLNYYEYHREKAKELLKKEFNWTDYGEKHTESRFTKWFQNCYLPQKFGLDKRIPHLSSLINSAQITRQQALEEIKKPREYEDVARELNMNFNDFQKMDYKDYKNSEWIWNLLSKIYAIRRKN